MWLFLFKVEDNRLPEGWTKHMVRRSLGHSAGKWDVVLVKYVTLIYIFYIIYIFLVFIYKMSIVMYIEVWYYSIYLHYFAL